MSLLFKGNLADSNIGPFSKTLIVQVQHTTESNVPPDCFSIPIPKVLWVNRGDPEAVFGTIHIVQVKEVIDEKRSLSNGK